MQISKRFDDHHSHGDGVCVVTHQRAINNKTFIFSEINRKDGRKAIYVDEVYHVHGVVREREIHKFISKGVKK